MNVQALGCLLLGQLDQARAQREAVRGKQYGWPHIWDTDGVNPQSTR
jgi:hypothetical protein